jgi:hypothetical protein
MAACRAEICQIPRPDDRDFCDAHWRRLPLELRGQLLGCPPGPGRNNPIRNQVLHKALTIVNERGFSGSR